MLENQMNDFTAFPNSESGMLEIKNVTKVYKSKNGESVVALNNLNISFPGAGMVFILGKSGSGKSTLLNVIGGLDSYDSGEFVIMGKSSKDFGGSDFDAYRNTFIGFIFQEYNILDEFSVGANIGLALELQGKKATSEQINHILSQVDLVNFAGRKPNELSGGQKQRVAIARALVKEPQIIMADEPTGALDSNTGKQIFDSLKELSKEKLVLVVSHDRDFAERYADRIIELSDGNIISDVTRHEVEGVQVNKGIRRINQNLIRIDGGYQLTEEDVRMINEYLKQNAEGLMLSGDPHVNGELRSAAGVTESGGTAVFEQTDGEKDIARQNYDGSKTKFIRSKLPAKNALKMGASGLKHKKFRLVLTILLSLVAFGMFGLADSMGAYDKIRAAVRSIEDSNVANASVSLGVKSTWYWSDEEEPQSYYYRQAMNDQDIADLKEKTGLDFVPVFNGGNSGGYSNISLSQLMIKDTQSDAYTLSLSGFTALDDAAVKKAGLKLAAGRMPTAPGEIAITEFIYRQFKENGFKNEDMGESVTAEKLNMEEGSADSILGKHIFTKLTGSYSFQIVGVLDTGFDYDRYAQFLPSEKSDALSKIDVKSIAYLLLCLELSDTLEYGMHTLGYLYASEIADIAGKFGDIYMELGESFGCDVAIAPSGNSEQRVYFNSGVDDSVLDKLHVTYLDGQSRKTLADDEYVISQESMLYLIYQSNRFASSVPAMDAKGIALYGQEAWDSVGNVSCSYCTRIYEAAAFLKGEDLTDAEFNAACAEFYPVLEQLFQIDISETPGEMERSALTSILYSLSSGDEDQPCFDSTMAVSYLAYFYTGKDFEQKNMAHNNAFLGYVSTYLKLINPDEEELKDAYKDFLQNGENHEFAGIKFGSISPAELNQHALTAVFNLSGITAEDFSDSFDLQAFIYVHDERGSKESTLFSRKQPKIVGYYTDTNVNSSLLINNSIAESVRNAMKEKGYYYSRQVTAPHEPGIWAFAIAPMPEDSAAIRQLVEMNYDESGDYTFSLQNQVMQTLGNFNDFIETGAKVFLWVGVGFAVFSALLLMNFISISISYKKREIGILRAVGARSSDVFKIFFSESLIIALINYLLAVFAAAFTVFALNRWMRTEGINVTLLEFGIRQLALMLLISVGVAMIASFLPVWRIARRKPIDAIRDK